MNGNFAAVVDGILKLSLEEKEELRSLLDKYLIEARREEILDNFLATRKDEEQGKLKTPRDPMTMLFSWISGLMKRYTRLPVPIS